MQYFEVKSKICDIFPEDSAIRMISSSFFGSLGQEGADFTLHVNDVLLLQLFGTEFINTLSAEA